MIRWFKSRKIVHIFQKQLLICIIFALAVTCLFMALVQFRIGERETDNLLYLNLQDVRADISDWSDENLLELAHTVADLYPEYDIGTLSEMYGIAEINIVAEDGIITDSTDGYVGFDMASGEQSSEFLVLLSGETEFVQDYRPVSIDQSISRKYAGIALPGGGFLQIGYDTEEFQADLAYQVHNATKNRHIGENGYILIADVNWDLVSDRMGGVGEDLSVTGLRLDTDETPEDQKFYADVYGETCACMYETIEGYYIIAVYPKSEAVFSRNLSISLTVGISAVIFAVLFVLIYFMIRRMVVENIRRINAGLSRITGGDLDVVLEETPVEEFTSLSDDINTTVRTLKHYIEEAEHQNERELLFAEQVQYATLPGTFPPFPERTDLDLYAAMYTAKEVGGDFYDFYFLGEDRLVFLIADVSGKGIPAAMFMMRAKTLIKGLTESIRDAGTVLRNANEALCESNMAELFVTAWLGVLDMGTGVLEYANAGHNPPVIRRNGGDFEMLSVRPGFVLAGMNGINYRTETVRLSPGDVVFLYTDGVIEAVNPKDELYGADRMIALLNRGAGEDPDARDLCSAVKADVDAFMGGAAQFDDMTMLALRYLGGADGKEITADAVVGQMDAVTEFADRRLEEMGCPAKTMTQINIALDELVGNVVKYAYPSGTGTVTVRLEEVSGPQGVLVTLTDHGTPYNPLSRTDPDITLPAEERSVGGLGIFLVKRITDDISYEYSGGCNVLRFRKNFSEEGAAGQA